MDSPFVELIWIVLGAFISGLLYWLFEILLNKFDVNIADLLKHFPSFDKNILLVLVGWLFSIVWLVLWAVFGMTMLTWGDVAYNYYLANDYTNLIYSFLFNVFGCLYMAFTTKDLETRRHW